MKTLTLVKDALVKDVKWTGLMVVIPELTTVKYIRKSYRDGNIAYWGGTLVFLSFCQLDIKE